MPYDPAAIEAKWQAHWAAHKTFRTPSPGEPANGKLDPQAPKFYVLDMFPYPSGVGLHVGHPLGYIATDIVARYKRMRGFNVLHPMGFDAFGLAAEQFAVEHGVHPRITTEQNIGNMVKQFKLLGLGYDWDRTLSTTDVGYYRWTQWIFLQLFNSYFDPIEKKALPIAELQLRLQNEQYYVGLDGELVHAGAMEDLGPIAGDPTGAKKWSELANEQQRRLLDEYRLAYIAEVPVNWCPALGTVLANEEVTNDGRSERGNHPVFKRPLKQWMMRITAYAERLAGDLDFVDWPESTKLLQRNWIGRSEGAEVDFPLHAGPEAGSAAEGPGDARGELITVFTTRPDTLFGATYMVLAPEHPLVDAITTPEQRAAVDHYRTTAAAKADIDRQADTKTKTGVPTGAFAINPVNGREIPVWIADYVLMGYGTGAIMAVPAHDQRDYDFAAQFSLPIVPVLDGDVSKQAFTGDAPHINSTHADLTLDGLDTPTAKRRMIDWLEKQGVGRSRVQYKLRDWIFSRQRYWGEPFPILHDLDTGEVVAVDEAELPVRLPEMEDFTPRASDDPDANVETPLSRAPDSWKYVERNGKRYVRELNTMPQWAGSCWYYLRYLDNRNDARLVGSDAERYWMAPKGVDLYVGGVEHAVLHLLYARFWHKVLYDLGHVSTPEPFAKLFNQGYIQAYYYEDARGVRVPVVDVVDQDGKPAMDVQDEKGRQFFYKGQPVSQRYGKMGKSLKNAIAPEEVIAKYGTDTLRLYEMYMGPLDQSKVWNTRDMVGSHRFLQRLWRNLIVDDTDTTGTGTSMPVLRVSETAPTKDLARLAHATIKRVTEAMESMSFNVAIAALIQLNNELVALEKTPRWIAEQLVVMLAPLAPHVAEELWQRLGHGTTVADADWPTYDADMLVADTVEYPVQVSGKLRGKVTVPADADDAAVEAAARADEKVQAALAGKTVRKVIVVKNKLINLVAG